MPTVYFAHGKESGPWGHKIRALADVAARRGVAVESVDYRFTLDPDERVRHLLGLDLPRGEELILAGSSMGGYVAACASRHLAPRGLYLLAPAVDMPGYDGDTTPGGQLTEVVHGWRDPVIPVERAIAWSRRHRARLHLLDSGHTLQDALPWLCRAFDRFLEELLVAPEGD